MAAIALVALGLEPSPAVAQPAAGAAALLPDAPDQSQRATVAYRLLGQPPLAGPAVRQRRGLGGHARGVASLTRRRFVAGPEVRLAEPAPLHAPVDARLQLEFSEPVDVASVVRSFRMDPAVEGVWDWPDARTGIFSPAAPLAYRTTYRVSVAGLAVGAGNLSAAGSFTFATVWQPPSLPFPFTLTFDDCGTADGIQAILSALDDRGLHAIFFPTGLCRDQFPWLVPALLAAGHRVCNHTYSHPDLSRLSYGAITSEIQRGVAVGCDLFRPPYGAMDRSGRVAGAAAALGYRIQLWDVDTRDWAGTPADVMVAMIRARGGVVLMHMHGIHTVEAIRLL